MVLPEYLTPRFAHRLKHSILFAPRFRLRLFAQRMAALAGAGICRNE
jgi:hypothetical protein